MTAQLDSTPAVKAAALQPLFAFNLADLQQVASLQFGMTRRQTLAAAQALYERGLITYPLVEERELPENMFDEAARIVRDYKMVTRSREFDPGFKGPVWVPEVPGAHHAIMLTTISAAAVFGVNLSDHESHVYGLVHERHMNLFKRT